MTARRARARTRLLAVAAAVLAVAGSLAACQGHANDFSSAAGSTTLTLQGDSGNPTLTENFNPYAVPGVRLGGTLLMYEPLEIISPVDGRYQPFLATSYRFTNPTTLVYTLRSGVKWSDGTPFTVKDVLFSFDLLKKFPTLDTTGVWSEISGVSGSGDTFTVRFKTANVPFAGTVAAVPIVPAHIWDKVANPVKFTNTHPVGTGPFELDTFSPTGYTLRKNPSYWNAAKIAPAKVDMPAQSTNQSTNQLEVSEGAYDWAYNFIPRVKQTFLARSSYNRYWFPPGGAICLYLNLTKAPYTDVHFRLGISDSLNRNLVAQKAVNGYLTGASQSGLILPNLKQWLDPKLPHQGYVTQDLAAATAQFKDAGYTERNGRLENAAGKPATMTISVPSNYSDWVAGAKEVANELGRVGIAVTLSLPQATQYTQVTQSGNFDAAFGGLGGTGVPYSDYGNALNSAYAAKVGTPTVNNFERFDSPATDSALATLARATTFSQQAPATYALEKIMYEQAPIITLYYGGSWGLFSVKNFTGWPSAADPYTLPTPYNNAILVVLSHLVRATA